MPHSASTAIGAPHSATTPRRMLITGAAGHLGRLIMERMLARSDVQSVIALDRRPSAPLPADERVVEVSRDVRHGIADLVERLQVDTILHLAYPLEHQRHYGAIRPFSREGTHDVLRAVQLGTVRKLVLFSSTTVYGGHAHKRGLWSEEDRPRPNRGYHYARGKLEMETIATRWAKAHTDVELVIVRPCIVLGPATDNYMVRGMLAPELQLRDYDPAMQFMHEDDFCAAIETVLRPGVRGTFNLTPSDGGVKRSELLRLIGVESGGRSYLHVKSWLRWRWWLLRGQGTPISPAVLDLVAHSWAASSARLQRATGFRPRYSSEETVLAFFKAYRSKRRRNHHDS